MNMKRLLWGFLMIAAVALTGCGSDGDGGRITDLQNVLNAVNADLATAQTDLTTAQTDLTTAQTDLATAQTDLATAQTDLATAQADLAAAPTQADLATANADLATAQTDLATAQTDLATAQTDLATAQTDLATANERLMALDADLAKQMRQAKIDAATAVETALDTAKLKGGKPNATTIPVEEDFAKFKVERGTDGMVEVSVTASPASSEKFTGEVAAENTWTHITVTRSPSNKKEETLKIITDIEAPEAKPISEELTRGSLDIAKTGVNRKYIKPATTPAGLETLKYEEGEKFSGTFRGIEGEYECTDSAGCNVSLDETTKKDTTTGTVSFIPNSVSATYDDPDTDYLVFGVWKEKDESGSGTKYKVAPYAFSIGIVEAKPMIALEGSAKYVGEAAGAFVTKTFTAGNLTDADSGIFTAISTLTADFDDGVADSIGSIEGTIDNFKLDTENVDPSEWEVTLDTISLAKSASSFSKGETDVSFGGDTNSNVGTWAGTFYGPDTKSGTEKQYPGMVAGTFDAHTSGANLIGGFGAHLE